MSEAGGKAVIVVHRAVRVLLLGFVPVIAVVIGLYVYATGGQQVETDNAYVKANIVPISSGVTGRVIEVLASDNQPVEAGAVLFRLDPVPYQIAVDGARAQMEVVHAAVQSLRAEYRATLQEAAEARSRIDFLEKQLARQEYLKEKGMSRGDTYDEARHNVEAAKRRLASIREKTNRVIADLSGNPDTPVERIPRYAEARAAYDAAMLDLSRALIKAPFAGVVSNMKLQVGEFVEKGAPMFSLIETGPLWVEANYKETQLTYMMVGQSATVAADAYPDHEWPGSVEAIAPATGAEFAVLPPQNATGNWVKVVQRVPVRIKVQQPQGMPQLRAGMTVTVSVDTGRPRGLPRVVQKLVDHGWLPRFLVPSSAIAGTPRR
ncbi:MAG TPA: HlyD family secretion protein [Burkholderiales bacterium]|nr:HlyD family secretion protein [Burkholderiales bacterium]